jgi:hypothetical protein
LYALDEGSGMPMRVKKLAAWAQPHLNQLMNV